MQFDQYTIALLILRPDAPELDDEAAAALQDAHMAHLADLHEAGHLLAAGHLSDEKFRGLSILNVEPERARHPDWLALDETPDVLAAHQRNVLAELGPVEIEQAVPMPTLLLGHGAEHLRRVGSGLWCHRAAVH